MAFTASPKQLQLLTLVVEEYCRDCGITDTDERLYVAELASGLFDLGAISMHDLRRGLDDAVGPCSRPANCK